MINQLLARLLLIPLALAAAGIAHAELSTIRVEARIVARSHPAEATLEAVHQVALAAQVPGRIVALNVDAGDRVAKGEVLLRIDAVEAAQAVAGAEAGIAAAQANLINAKAAFERTARRVGRPVGSTPPRGPAEAG